VSSKRGKRRKMAWKFVTKKAPGRGKRKKKRKGKKPRFSFSRAEGKKKKKRRERVPEKKDVLSHKQMSGRGEKGEEREEGRGKLWWREKKGISRGSPLGGKKKNEAPPSKEEKKGRGMKEPQISSNPSPYFFQSPRFFGRGRGPSRGGGVTFYFSRGRKKKKRGRGEKGGQLSRKMLCVGPRGREGKEKGGGEKNRANFNPPASQRGGGKEEKEGNKGREEDRGVCQFELSPLCFEIQCGQEKGEEEKTKKI